ncbi:MAG TPA: YbhB/YbcL family Raf kinase inhibitor-like protein [Terriglobales bacterium]|nr:YbhB/YbcL family Raf kinase inhibitor-like protein [Terriglobales bacterium]
MLLTSSAFQQGGEIPSYHTSDGENVSPELSWQDAPAQTRSFALIVHDPDAPMPGGFTHWIVYNIPSDTQHVQENVPAEEQVAALGMQGKNDSGKIGYTGPAPPSGTHRYFFRLYALDKMIDVGPGATHKEIAAATKGHILAQSELMGTYEKKSQRAA